MGHKSISLLGLICACCLVTADDFAWVTHEPFATENLVSIAPSGPQQVTAVTPWPQQWHSPPMQQQQQQQQQHFNTGRMLFHSSGPWNNNGIGGGGGTNDIATIHLQGPGPGSWQGGNAPWQSNSVALPWQLQQHQQQSQNHHQNHRGPPSDLSLPWSTQQPGHIATFSSLSSPPAQHPPNPWQNMAPMGGAPWQYQQNHNNQNNYHNNNNNNHPPPPHQHQQQHQQQQSNQQHHQQQQQQQPPPEPSLPRTQVKLIYVPIPIVRSVTQQAISPQQGQWQQQGGTNSGGGGSGGASVQVIWPQQQQQGGSQSAWQPGVKTRAFSVPSKTMGSAGAVIPIVISLQTTSSRGSSTSKSEYSPRVATSRSDSPRSAWW
ncbi:uncharacterized protein LOC142774707 [Rhipicephalus microplus]|uniref:uncharacterized protein LOC142774707 n=1 Tax=Rhipicephalus microplus TaxID=6941 RepID=UPI003F6AF016